MKEDFDLDMDALAGGKRPRKVTSRQVRRHDIPDPTPSKPFDEPEEKIAEIQIEENFNGRTSRSSAGVRGSRDGGAVSQKSTELIPRSRRSAATGKSVTTGTRAGRSGRRAAEDNTVVSFFKDRRLHVFIGVVLVILGVVTAIVLISHLRNAATDQNRVLNETVSQMAQSSEPVQNAGAAIGAWLSHALFADALGLGAFVMAIYLVVIGACLVARLKLKFWAFTFKSLLLATTISVVSGLVTYASDTSVFWGGVHGHYVNKFLYDNAGFIGMVAVSLILIAAVVCVFYFPIRHFCSKCKSWLPPLRRNKYEYQSNEVPEQNQENEVRRQLNQDFEDESDNAETQALQQSAAAFSIDSEDDSMVIPIDDDEQSASGEDSQKGEPGFEITVATIEQTDESALKAEPHVTGHCSELPDYVMPSLDLLEDRPVNNTIDREEQQRNKERIVKTLGNYKIEISSIKATVGPTVTLYEVVPADGVRIAQIKNLEDDIAMSLSATGIRIIAPMPGKGTVGIEVPNADPQTVSMRSVLASKKFQESNKHLPVALGATIQNEVFVADLASMPHALVAGATGQGKSVGLNAIIASLLYKKHPSELKFVLIDPKMVEFSLYSKLENHYLAKLPDDMDDDAIITDPQKVLAVLNSLTVEMENRLLLLRSAGVRDIVGYNEKYEQNRLSPSEGHHYLPYIVVIIDEFADLILSSGKEIESPVARLTAKARAVGIHLIIATQRPSTNVLTGLIKANCPARIAFRTQQMVDSRTILDRPGANHLVGKGDMLYSTGGALERMQCAFISTDEVERIVDYVRHQPSYGQPYYLPDPKLAIPMNGEGGEGGMRAGAGLDRDPLFDECARFIVRQDTASTSSLQRRFEIGYNRAGKIMDQLEAAGVVGPAVNSKPRNVLMDPAGVEAILGNR